jgi:regulator of chromosome condensation
LGRDGDENLPTLLKFPTRIIVTSLSLGESHGVCVSLAGQVYLWGSYRDKDGKTFFPTTAIVEGNGKQSGTGTISKHPAELKGMANIVSCSSGANHTVLLAGDGDVYSLGFGEQNQLGRQVSTKFKIPHPTDKEAEDIYDVTMIHREHLVPLKIKLEASAKSIGCGAYHTLIISSVRSQVYGCGLNQYRQIAPLEKDSLSLTHLTHLDGKNITFIRGGEHYSLALSTDGAVYTWGRSDQGQLGRPVENKAGSFDPIPQRVLKLPPVSQVYPASSHVLARTITGHVYSWGFGEMLQLGHGENVSEGSGGYGMQLDQPLPKQIERFAHGNVFKVCAGAQHSCVLVGSKGSSN